MRYSEEELIKVHTNSDQQYTTLFHGRCPCCSLDGRTTQVKVDSKREKDRLTYENHQNSHKLLPHVNVELPLSNTLDYLIKLEMMSQDPYRVVVYY